MSSKSRIGLQVGAYNKPYHYAVIGSPVNFYIWYKPPKQGGLSSAWFEGDEAFKHYNHMRKLIHSDGNNHAFVSYLTDLYYTNPKPE